MKVTLELLDSIEKFAKDELLEFLVLTSENKEISLFILKAILEAIEEERSTLS